MLRARVVSSRARRSLDALTQLLRLRSSESKRGFLHVTALTVANADSAYYLR